MLALVLLIGSLNLALGFLLAMWWEPPAWLAGEDQTVPASGPRVLRMIWSLLRLCRTNFGGHGRFETPHGGTDHSNAPACAEPVPLPVADASRQVLASLPEAWAILLESESLQPASRFEALLWVMRSAAMACRQALQAIHQYCYRDPAGLDIKSQCQQASDAWEEQLGQWSTWLRQERETTQPVPASLALEQFLGEWAARLDAARVTDQPPSSSTASAEARPWEGAVFGEGQGKVQRFREHVESALADLLRDDGRLGQLPHPIQRDVASRSLSFLGMQVFLLKWLQNDAERVRAVSGVLVGVENVADLREQHGSLSGEQLVAAAGGLLEDLVRRERSHDAVVRLTDETYLVFLGDTALRNAVTAAERIRQTVASTSFYFAGQEATMTVSCATTEWLRDESAGVWIERLRSVLVAGRAAGRNRTWAADADGIREVPPAKIILAKREIEVGAVSPQQAGHPVSAA